MSGPRNRIYRWDLDKTYLRTEFDTVRDLVRTALEKPKLKRTVPGAAALLREIRATGPAGVYILSGSPEQMRSRLEQKLTLDGIQWDEFILKPSLRRLLRGQVRFLRDQVSYKLGSLLRSRAKVDPDTTEILFGDDAEADAFVYSFYAAIISGQVKEEEILAVLEKSRAYEDDIELIVESARQIETGEIVERIFIHLDRVRPATSFESFGSRVCPFYNYLQPALVLVQDGVLGADAALRVGGAILQEREMSPEAMGASFDDLVRRGFVGRVAAERLLEASLPDVQAARVRRGVDELLRGVEARLESLPDELPTRRDEIDFPSLYLRDHALARMAKIRATRRRR